MLEDESGPSGGLCIRGVIDRKVFIGSDRPAIPDAFGQGVEAGTRPAPDLRRAQDDAALPQTVLKKPLTRDFELSIWLSEQGASPS